MHAHGRESDDDDLAVCTDCAPSEVGQKDASVESERASEQLANGRTGHIVQHLFSLLLPRIPSVHPCRHLMAWHGMGMTCMKSAAYS